MPRQKVGNLTGDEHPSISFFGGPNKLCPSLLQLIGLDVGLMPMGSERKTFSRKQAGDMWLGQSLWPGVLCTCIYFCRLTEYAVAGRTLF